MVQLGLESWRKGSGGLKPNVAKRLKDSERKKNGGRVTVCSTAKPNSETNIKLS